MVRWIVRLEGIVFFLLSLVVFMQLEGNILYFFLFLLVPDISMIGYLRDKKIGAILYNLMHNYVAGVAVFILGILIGNDLVGLAGLILIAHVGMDRAFGFGLKYSTKFQDTHIQKV